MDNPLRKVETNEVPRPLGHYSQAVVSGGFVFVSGSIGQSPITGELVLVVLKQRLSRLLTT